MLRFVDMKCVINEDMHAGEGGGQVPDGGGEAGRDNSGWRPVDERVQPEDHAAQRRRRGEADVDAVQRRRAHPSGALPAQISGAGGRRTLRRHPVR